MSDLGVAVASTVDHHKYEISGTCACGAHLGASHGAYKAAWRRHLVAALTQAVAATDVAAVADLDTFTLAAELVRRGFLRVELDLDRAMDEATQ